MIGRLQVDSCSQILGSDQVTNFEVRMVAEVNLYWILYEQCCTADVDLPKAQSSLHSWKQDWKLVLGKLNKFFVEMCRKQLLKLDGIFPGIYDSP